MNNVTETTNKLVQRWVHAKNNLKRLDREKNSAECELANAANELGKWLVPTDQGDDEQPFNIWFGSGILQAIRSRTGANYIISWRKEPDGKDRLEFGA